MAGFKKNKRGEKETAEPGSKRRPWTDAMVLKPTGQMDFAAREKNPFEREVSSFLTRKVRWENVQDPKSFRVPQPVFIRHRAGEGFTAGGKRYDNLSQLLKKAVPEECGTYGDRNFYRFYEDKYGREVLWFVTQKGPYRNGYQNPGWNWFFLREYQEKNGERYPILIQVFRDDDSPFIYVTEDVGEIEDACWRLMIHKGYWKGEETYA